MRSSTCAELAELRSALVDGALSHPDRERVLAHLVGCDGCRREVAELRALRGWLAGRPAGGSAPSALSSRLVSIAGSTGPERRVPGPWARRVAAGTAGALTVVGSVLGVGWAAAPPEAAAAVGDPTVPARAEFSAVLASLPLGTDAVAAVLASGAGLRVHEIDPLPHPPTPGGRRLSSGDAYERLVRASRARDTLSYTGVARVSAVNGGHAVAAMVELVADAGRDTELRVSTVGGRFVRNGSSPRSTSGSRVADSELLALLARNYALSGRTGSTVAGRPATLVEARPHRTGPDGPSPVAGRWWVDDATGLVLQWESYDDDGMTDLAAAFSSLTVGSAATPSGEAPPLVVPSTSAALTVSHAEDLSDHGWFCAEKLARMSLVRLRRGDAAGPETLHLVYSDGMQTVSVVETRGRLPESLPGWQRDAGLTAHVRLGAPSLATWQSDDIVFTVVTSGSADLLRATVEALPAEVVARRTSMERVQAGWARILDPRDR
ncbi:MAG: zf-HC2 domain-containing protein [Actinomycetes bacterium]